MTFGQRLKALRKERKISQEALAEELSVSRSAIAKWESDLGLPELENLMAIAAYFHTSMDTLLGNTVESSEEDKGEAAFTKTGENVKEERTSSSAADGYLYDLELEGLNDGVYDVQITGEDEDFFYYYRFEKKKTIHGMLGKRFITRMTKKTYKGYKSYELYCDRGFFEGRRAMVETVLKKGFLSGFFDFHNDDLMDVEIVAFDEKVLTLNFGKKIDVAEITKVEEI